ncbi:pyruvate dehydrogenase E1 component beta subunit [Thermosporothrix hazakensis]|jgi:pyruvate dehydrogenase E1 component beta subunit|uniref:Pyruvate dehydrogenase E1 component beta subunit n=1 Tax=Thermosporothrix hazakensis TaxID=644383 RepID=A0A326U714_THEHA|nr:alpha-ketoacid dehydrogenase subunit beta [Thermosporothrix hazakensis]PZW26397.1 pyruvate dehydrogenase E1 component beta subunit [Thermosporothrix hazakensis]GCE48652.1 2-oxoisovalerate dehydrogenase subunit beta [Thermosporothrix hazakensis]
MQMTMIEALNNALALILERDQRVVLLGQDIGANGGVFRVTERLQERFGEQRVFDTPLAESAIIGSSVGMAVYGMRPVAEIQFAGFLYVGMNQLVTQAARMRFRSGGVFTCPLVVRAPYGGGVRTPELHSDSLEGLFLQTPGLKVVIPSNPYDAKGLLVSAVDDPDPVVFLENIKLYRSFRQETPEDYYTVPLGKANVVQAGEDVSLFAYGAMVPVALDAARQIQQETGATVEVIDLRTIWPLDEEAIVSSVSKTGRAVVVHEAPRAGGVGAEIVSILNEQCLYSLLKPVERVTGYDTPFPVPGQEDYYLPNARKVRDAIRRVLEP